MNKIYFLSHQAISVVGLGSFLSSAFLTKNTLKFNLIQSYSRRKLLRLGLAAVLILFAGDGIAANPGGVTGALVWMKANAGTSTTTNGTGISTWTNQMGGGNGTQTTAVNQPTFQIGNSDMINYNPVVRFNNINSQSFNLSANIFGNGTARTAANMFVLAKNSTISTNSSIWYEENTTLTSRVNLHVPWSDGNIYWDAGSITTAERLTVPVATAGINITSPFIWSFLAQTNTQSLKRDGSNVASNGSANITYSFNNAAANRNIGRGPTTGGYYGGDIGEIIGYGTSLTATQILQIESYLALKYGKTLLQTTTQNYLASNGTTVFWNSTTNTGYNNNIAGIARDDDSDLTQKQSKSVNAGLQIVVGNGNIISTTNTLNSSTFSVDKSALIWGDNAGDVTAWTQTAAPYLRKIIARKWKVQETGTVGSVKIQVPDNSGTNGLPLETNTVYLLVDADGNFASGATEIAMTLNGTNWEADVNLTSLQFFTFATVVLPAPGGVISNFKLWLKANDGTTNTGNNTNITAWSDKSGTGNNSTPVTAPLYKNNTSDNINFNPVVAFNGTTQSMNLPSTTFPAGNNSYGVYFVGKSTKSSAGDILSSGTATTAWQGFRLSNTSNMIDVRSPGSSLTGATSAGNGNTLLTGWLYNSASGRQMSLFGKSDATDSNVGENITQSATKLGVRPDGTTTFFQGTIAEVVYYSDNHITSTYKSRIESYLALKYGITLDQTTAQNYLASDGTTIYWNGTTNSVYKNNIAGISRDDVSALNQKQSKSVNSGLQVVIGNGNTIAIDNESNTTTFTADKSAFMWGDNAGIVANWTTTGAPTTYLILPRTWKVQETSTVGSVKVQVADNSGSNGLPAEQTKVYLLVDSDGNFATGATITQLTLNGTNWEGDVDFTTGQFFTFATEECTPAIGIPVFTLGATSTRCQGAGSVLYTATSTNSTGISYSLDANSITGGNSIIASTGQVTFISGWSGTSIITATAVGCKGPTTSTHTVTITPTVGTPVFITGATSTRCRAAGTVTYTASASNATSITYSLDATSSLTNTINASTGAVTFSAAWSGISTITAIAAGCNGPSQPSIHTVTSTAVVAVKDTIRGEQGEPAILNILANDYCDVNTSSVTIVSQPSSGSLQVGANGLITFLPNGSFNGTDHFTYQVCSNAPIVCTQAEVTIIINEGVGDVCSEATRSKTFYLPFPENTSQLRKALISAANTANGASDNVRSVLSIKMPYPGTRIVYDHWEDGYEADITFPTQSTTLIWGDGNLNNGIAPGYNNDIIPAGGYVYIDNQFAYNPRVSSTVVFDGKDKLFSTNDISVSKVVGDAKTGTFNVQNVKTNVFDTSRFGTLFTIPFGEDITLGSTGAFKYTGLFVRATTNGTIVKLDYDNNGTVDQTSPSLNEGEVWFYDGTASSPGVSGDVNTSIDIKSGAKVTANYPVGVDLIFGGIDNYGTRNLALLPGAYYGSTYYCPVYTTLSDAPVYAFFTNSLTTAITINYTSGTGGTGTVVVPAGGANYLSLSNTAAYKFKSAGGESFTAVAVIDADVAGSAYDWSFNMIPENRLSTFTSIAWAPGSNNLSANYNPVWVTAPSATTLYIKYDGDLTSTTATMSPCGIPFDIAVPITALQSYRIFDTSDNNQTGLAVYTCDGTPIAAVWGQDPNAGTPTPTGGGISMDVGYVMEPRCLSQLIIANDDQEVTEPNTPIKIGILTNDYGFLCNVNTSSVTTAGLLQPLHGTAVINSDGTITYTPNAGFQGTDLFEYRICSIEYPGECDIALVTVKVTECSVSATESLISGKVFLEQLTDDGLYNNEAGVAGVRINLYNDVNCSGTVDGADAITLTTISDFSGNYDFSVVNGYNAKDNFDPTAALDGNDGGVNWSGTWTENGESDGINAGNVQIISDPSSGGMDNAIRLSGSSKGISRSLTFNNATGATLRFSYRRQAMTDDGQELLIKINGTQAFAVDDGNTVGTDQNYTYVVLPLSSFNANSSNTVQFITNGSTLATNYYWIDNVELIYFRNPACYIVKVDPTNTGGVYTASALNTRTVSFTGLGVCSKNNYLGVLASLTAANDNVSTATNTSIDINVLANDILGKPNAATVTTTGMTNQPANGTVVVNSNGTITYTPNPGFNGTDDFQYRVCSLEDPAICSIALVTVDVSCLSVTGKNTINGIVFNDLDNDGVLDVSDADFGGIDVNLYRDTNGNSALDTGEPLIDTKTSQTNGSYGFTITPPTTTSTYLDQFSANTTANQTNGTVTWSTSWTEVGTSNGFATAPVRILSSNGLRIEGNATATFLGAYRVANISTAVSATLSFSFAETLDLEVNDYVDVQIATSSSPTSWTLLKRYTGADGNQSGTGTFDISAFLSATTTIRFVTSGIATVSASNYVDFDNVQISFNVPTTAKYIVQLKQPFYGFTLKTPTPHPTGIHTASFSGAGSGDCANNFGLVASPIAENDINQTPMNMPVSGQLMTNDEGVVSITGATIAGNPIPLGVSTPVSGVDKWGNAVTNAGSIIINSTGIYTFTPSSGFIGTINPIYTGAGINGLTDTAILSIEVLPKVQPGNNPPVAQNDVATTEINVPISSTILTNDSDPDGDVLTVTTASIDGSPISIGTTTIVSGTDAGGNLVTNAGTITLNSNGTYSFNPANGFIGTVKEIPYTISDGKGGTDTAILSINVIGNYGNNTFANDDANSAPKGVSMLGNVLTNDTDPEGNTQTISSAKVNESAINIGSANTLTGVGSLTLNTDGSYTFAPLPNYVGTTLVIYNKCDNGVPTACDEATLYLTSLPREIIAENDINQTPMNTQVSGQLMTNDEGVTSILDATTILGSAFVLGSPKTVSGVNEAGVSISNAGSLTINSTGTYIFTPSNGFVGTIEPITYTGGGAGGSSDKAILSIEVLPVLQPGNNPPVAQNDVNTTEVGVPISSTVITNDSDPDDDALIVTGYTINNIIKTPGTTSDVGGVNSGGMNVEKAGTIQLNEDGTYLFTPVAGFVGTVNDIPYSISDGNGGADAAILSILVVGNYGNNTFANDDANSASQGIPMAGNVLSNDTDPEGDNQTVTSATINGTTINIGTLNTIVGVGSLLLNANGTYTFTPLSTYVGTLPVIYNKCDNGILQACDQATLYLTSLPRVIYAENDINQTPINTAVSGLLLTNDEGVSSVTEATIKGNAIPLATSTTVSGVDKNNVIVTNAGSIVINSDGTYIFTPATGFVGTIDPITYTGVGISGGSDTAILSIEVLPKILPGNNPPVAQNDVNTTEVNIPISSTVINNDSDPDGDNLTVTTFKVDGVAKSPGTTNIIGGVSLTGLTVANAGTILLNANGSYTYTPAGGFVGILNDIPYTIVDGNGGTDAAILSIIVIGNNSNTTFANDDANSAPQGEPMNGNVLTNDTDPESDLHTVTSATVNGNSTSIGSSNTIAGVGNLTLNANGSYEFEPLSTFSGTLPVIYNKCDDGVPVACDQATLYLTSIPKVVFAENDINQTPQDIPVTGQLLTNDRLIIDVKNASINGSPIPLATAINVSGRDENDLFVSNAGSIVIYSNGTYTFTPQTGFSGTIDPITYTGEGEGGATDTAILSIEVLPKSLAGLNPPVAQNDNASTETGVAVSSSVLVNDSDPDGDNLTVTSFKVDGVDKTPGVTAYTIGGVSSTGLLVNNAGTISLDANGVYIFTPAPNFVGTVNNVTYTINDGKGGSDTAILSIDVIGNNGNNTFANDDANSALQGVTMNGNVLNNDTDPEGDSFTVNSATIGGSTIQLGTTTSISGVGSFTLNTDGSYVFTPLLGYVGTLEVIYTKCDNVTSQACDEATLYLTSLPIEPCAWRTTADAPDWANDIWEALDCRTNTWYHSSTPPTNDRPTYIFHTVEIPFGSSIVSDSLRIETTGRLEVCGALAIDNEIIFKIDGAGKAGQLINNCGTNTCTVDVRNTATVIVRKTFATNPPYPWSFVSFPFNVVADSIFIAGTRTKALWGDLNSTTGDFYIGQYDGQKRANDGLTNGSNYVNVPGKLIVATKGYILAGGDANKSIDFKSVKGTDFICTTTTVPTSINVSSTGKTYCDEGWNLVGVPFVSGYNLNNATPYDPYFVWDGTKYVTVMADQDYSIYPFSSFFIQDWLQAYDGLTYNTDGQTFKAVRSVSKYDQISLSVSNEEFSDETRIRLKEDALVSFEQKNDGIKMMSSLNAVPQLYTEAAGSCSGIAVNALPLTTTRVDLKLRTGKAGTYTFRLTDKEKLGDVKKVLLIDDVTKAQTDLTKLDSYTYDNTVSTTTTSSRFYLLLTREEANGLTYIGNEDVLIRTQGKQVTLSGLKGTANVNFYDAVGKLIYQFNSVSNDNPLDINVPGMYIMDVNTATQKVRVKVLINNK